MQKNNNKCRACGCNLFSKPLLEFSNMPVSAQYLPDKNTVKSDKGVKLVVGQCSGCGLVQLTNKPVPYYREVIRAVAVSDEMKKFRLAQFRRFVKKYTLKGKKAIEIGCGKGEYLSILRQAGIRAFGLEYSSASVKHCGKKGLAVERGFIQRSTDKLKGAPFEAFFMFNFLEHLPAINPVLRGIYNNISNNGVGLIEVPNFDMIIKEKLFSEFIGDHLLYFTKDTLNATLRRNGFDVIECNEVWHKYIISAVVRKKNKLDITSFYKEQQALKRSVKEWGARLKGKKVAIWGAGHQALAIMAMTGLAGKIKYVVDSAAFKQGKFTPATHIPIVAPEMLKSDPVDAILVMAASYSDEVAAIIKRKHNKHIEISVVRESGLELYK